MSDLIAGVNQLADHPQAAETRRDADLDVSRAGVEHLLARDERPVALLATDGRTIAMNDALRDLLAATGIPTVHELSSRDDVEEERTPLHASGRRVGTLVRILDGPAAELGATAGSDQTD